MRVMAAWMVLACTERVGGPLDDPSAWTPVPEQVDPLAEHRPADVSCPVSTWGEENGVFEVQTGVCAYGAFEQPLVADLWPGDRLTALVWHDDLDAPEPAIGHVALLVGDVVVWEETVFIPRPATVFDIDVALPEGIEDASTIGFHLHNHGFNSWRVARMEWEPQ